MRLPKQKLAKEPSKHGFQAKHKKKLLKIERQNAKQVSKNAMDTESVGSMTADAISNTLPMTVQERLKAKQERKSLRRESVIYKKFNTAISGRNGPRAVTK